MISSLFPFALITIICAIIQILMLIINYKNYCDKSRTILWWSFFCIIWVLIAYGKDGELRELKSHLSSTNIVKNVSEK